MIITTMVDLAIDLAALEHNYRQLRGLCAPQVKMLAVVKADAYGHGLLPVARKLVAAGVDYLGVGSLDEGLMLRRAEISLPVLLLLGILPEEAEPAVAADLEVALFRLDVAQALAAAARNQGKKARVHLKVDTGMGRLGVLPQEVLPFLAGLKKMRHLKVMGLISHLAVADQADKTYTHKQLQEFTTLLAAARAAGLEAAPQSYRQQRRPLGAAGGSSGPGAAGSHALRLAPFPGSAAAGGASAGDVPGGPGPPGEAPAPGEQHQLRLHLHHPGLVRPGGAAGGLLQRLQPSQLQSGRGPHPWPPGPHPGPGVHEPHHGGGHRHPGGQGGRPGRVPGPGPGRGTCSAEELAGWAQTISYEVYCALGTANLRRYTGV